MNLLEKFVTKNPCYVANVNKADSRYVTFQTRGPIGLMLHSVGCAQPSAESWWRRWNNANYTASCVHGVIDANTGDVWQTLPWNFRGWHCGSGKKGSANNTHIGVEMAESKWISYTGGANFVCIDKVKAREDCKRTYNAAVELFAYLCKMWNLDPQKHILSHKEGGQRGIASGHVDPEHYWSGLGMSYTMDSFRADVKKKMEDVLLMTTDELRTMIEEIVEDKVQKAATALVESYGNELNNALTRLNSNVGNKIRVALDERTGPKISNIDEIPYDNVKEVIQKLLDVEAVDGGTSKEENDKDINLYWEDVRVLTISTRFAEYLASKIEDKILFKANEQES